MATLQESGPVKVDELFLHAAQAAQRLKTAITDGHVKDFHFDLALSALETLPLATNEFGVAQARVHNAMKMIARNEFGAAAYEVMLLANGLTRRASA
jgi:hypothetical protein